MKKQNFILTDVILLDIVGFSLLSNTQQFALITAFSELFRKTLSIMSGGKPLSNFILGTISTGDGFYTILDPSQKGFGAIYALSLKNVAKKLSSFDYFKGVKVAAHTGQLIPFVGMDGSKNFIGNGMNQCARYLEFKVGEQFEGYENGYAIMSVESHANLETMLANNKALCDNVEKLGVHITEEVAFKDKHSRKFKGYLIDSHSDSIITFATI
jgi:hypothetical protein